MGNEREEVIELHLWEAKFHLFRIEVDLLKIQEASLSMDSFQNPVRGAGPSNFVLIIVYAFSYSSLPQGLPCINFRPH